MLTPCLHAPTQFGNGETLFPVLCATFANGRFIVANRAARRYDYVLTDVAVVANCAVLHDVTEMPNTVSLPYGTRLVDV